MLTTIISFIVVIVVLVLVHELGHFLVAKACGVYVKEFMIGMGPKLFDIKGKETVYSIRALPIGGAVMMLGEDGIERDENGNIVEDVDTNHSINFSADDPRSFTNKSAFQRLAILFAGPFMNFIFAVVALSIVIATTGVASNRNIIGEVIVDNPAYQAGLMQDDEVMSINGNPIKSWQALSNVIEKSDGSNLLFEVLRDDKIKTIEVMPAYDEAGGRYIVGIYPTIEKAGTRAITFAIRQTVTVGGEIFNFIPKLITGKVGADQVAGPIGIAKISGEAASKGGLTFLNFMAYISINLGIMNLLPIPALDGGRILLILIEMIIRRKLPPKIEANIHVVGFICLMAIMVLVVFSDIFKLFGA